MKDSIISKRLWKENNDLAFKSLNCKFIRGIRDGNLPKEIFQDYIAQDYFFLESFAKAYGLAISKCSNISSINTLSKLLLGVSEELILHKTYVKKWDIDLTNHHKNQATTKYTDYLDLTSKTLNFIEILVSMAPCMRLYAWIGKNISEKTFDNPYKDWIKTYSDESFENLAKSLELIIDSYEHPYEFDHLNKIYNQSMLLELEFFQQYSNFN